MSHKRSGFSLVLSLAIMASMVMMVIVLAAFLQVETRLAQSHSGYMRARLNAMAAAKIALGQLQQLAGPDQRVTMRADMYDKGDQHGTTSSTTVPQSGSGDTVYNPSAPKGGKLSHQKRYWTGVWCTGGADSRKVRDWDVMNPHKSRLFLGWLSSPCYISDSSTTFFEIAEYKNGKPLPNYLPNRSYFSNNGDSLVQQSDGTYRRELANLTGNDGQLLIDSLGDDIPAPPEALVPLLSRGSISIPSSAKTRQDMEYYGQVDALPVPLAGPTSDSASTTLGINGRYAFWIGDEGIKAKANLPDAYANASDGSFRYSNTKYQTEGLDPWKEGFQASASQRNAIELIGDSDVIGGNAAGISDYATWRINDIKKSSSWDVTTIARVKDRGSLIMWANNDVSGAAAGDKMKAASKALFHDVTPWSYSTITDTYNGGIKTDLSTAFELPYAVYRGLEMYYGQKSSTSADYTKKASLFHDADFAAIGGSTGAVGELGAIDFNHPNLLSLTGTDSQILAASPRAGEWAPVYTQSRLGSAYQNLVSQNNGEAPERMGFVYEIPLRSAFYGGSVKRDDFITDIKNGRLERGPTWDLYRNYYRMYKREIEACTQTKTIQGQPATTFDAVFARGCDPLSYSTGKVESASYRQNSPTNFLLSGGTVKSAIRHNVASTDGAQYSLHQRGDDATDYYPLGKSNGSAPGTIPTIPWQTSMKLSPSIIRACLLYSGVWTNKHLGIAIDPIIVVHNPYDCAIEFSGVGMTTSVKNASHIFDFYYALSSNPNTLIQIGDIFPAQSFKQNTQLSFKAIAGGISASGTSPSAVFRLEPGEVRVIGATTPDPTTTSISGYLPVDVSCDFGYTQQSECFIPMDAYAVCLGSNYSMRYIKGSYSAAAAIMDPTKVADSTTYANLSKGAVSNPTKKQFNILTDVVNNLKNILGANWDGSTAMLNSIITSGSGIVIKPRNQNGLNFGGAENGTGDYFLFPTPVYNSSGNIISYNTIPRGSGHVVDGGSQDFDFYLLFNTSPNSTSVNLKKNRHWYGPVDSAAELLVDGSKSITSIKTVNEPLILSLKVVTSGWPLYGNAASAYGLGSFGPADPEFGGGIVGYDYAISGNYSAISQTLPDILGGISSSAASPTSTTYTTAGNWPIIKRANTSTIALGKQAFFMLDIFACGGTETTVDGVKTDYFIPVSNQTSYKNALGVTPVTVPNESMQSPMTPFAFSSRAQAAPYLAYDGKSNAPVGWVMSQRIVNGTNIIDMAPDPDPTDKTRRGSNAFWGTSVKTTGQTNVILFPIPRRPLLSLSQLGSAATSEVNTDPDLTVGASFAHPGIKDLSKITEWPGTKSPATSVDPAVPENGYASKIGSTSGTPVSTGRVLRHFAAVRSDQAFASNITLWDSYWFSGLNALASSYADGSNKWDGSPTGGGPNLQTEDNPIGSGIKTIQTNSLTADGVSDPSSLTSVKAALDSGKSPLANKRVAYRPDSSQTPGTMQNTIFPDYLSFPHPTYIGRKSLYDGGFNVNSTSKAAWKAVLGAMVNQKMPDIATSDTKATGIALTRFARAFYGKTNNNNGAKEPWNNYHDITPTELDDLATAVVNEVRRRGPFMSLSDFVNRRLVNDDNFGLKGALQAAIDATGMNAAAIDAAGGTFATQKGLALSKPFLPIAANDRFPSARAMSNKKLGNTDQKVIAGLGAPGIISQMDVLNSVGPNLTARSDTFVIRAFGEAFDNNGNSIGKAWVEVVTQRSSDFLAFTDQAAQSLSTLSTKVSAEPTVRDQTYRNNTGTSSDYDTKPILDKYQANPNFLDANLKPKTTDTAKLINLNRILGRRFNAVSLRWLNPQDI